MEVIPQTLGYDPHTFLTTPAELFQDPGADDYHLKEGCPAIDSGMWCDDVPHDLEGTLRPQGDAYDRGAYEYTPQYVPSLSVVSMAILFSGLGVCLATRAIHCPHTE
jgi:hypothetical protein